MTAKGIGDRGGKENSEEGRDGVANSEAVAAVLAIVIVASAVLVPALAGARVANEVPVHEAPAADASLSTPRGSAWGGAEPIDVPLASAPSDVPGANETSTEILSIRAARTDERLYVRLSWPDSTADRSASSPRSFTDAAAVQFPANENASTAISMGSTDGPVNVWYWHAGDRGDLDPAAYANATADIGGPNASDGDTSADAGSDTSNGTVEEVLAGGPGSTSEFDETQVNVSATHTNGEWTVVLSRPLSAAGANRTTLNVDRDVDVAVAVWNGSNAERSGRKSVSEWYSLALGPGPQGPPYQSVLWGIAGLAVVVVVAVTVTAVRRD